MNETFNIEELLLINNNLTKLDIINILIDKIINISESTNNYKIITNFNVASNLLINNSNVIRFHTNSNENINININGNFYYLFMMIRYIEVYTCINQFSENNHIYFINKWSNVIDDNYSYSINIIDDNKFIL